MTFLRSTITRLLTWLEAPRNRTHPDYRRPDPPSPPWDEPARITIEEDIARLLPPHNSADPAAWDRYWDNHLAAGFGPELFDIFLNDRALIRAMDGLSMRTVLCAGSGASLEPCALAAAGFDVVALDVSPRAFQIVAQRPTTPEVMAPIVDPASYRPGGKVTYVIGDLFDPQVAPGPFDCVLERRTAQNYAEPRFAILLRALLARLSPNGIFLTHCHDGCWRPPAEPRHVTAEWWLAQGGVLWHGDGPKPMGRVAWPVTSTG